MIEFNGEKLRLFVLIKPDMKRRVLAATALSAILLQPAQAEEIDARAGGPVDSAAVSQGRLLPPDADASGQRTAIDLAQVDATSPGGSAVSPPQPGEDEHAFWARVYAADTREGYELYLRRFPKGLYADIARAALTIQTPPVATSPSSHPVPQDMGGRNPPLRSPSSGGMGPVTPPPDAPEVPALSRPGGTTSGQFPPSTGGDAAKTTEFPIPRRPAEPGSYETIRATEAHTEPNDAAAIVDGLKPGTRLNVTGSEGAWLVVYSKTRNRTVYVKRDDAMLISERDAAGQSGPGPESQWKDTERRIQEVISRQGLNGISVSFIGDTAFLRGSVRTDAERSTAELAARSFPEVLHIHNGIWVKP